MSDPAGMGADLWNVFQVRAVNPGARQDRNAVAACIEALPHVMQFTAALPCDRFDTAIFPSKALGS